MMSWKNADVSSNFTLKRSQHKDAKQEKIIKTECDLDANNKLKKMQIKMLETSTRAWQHWSLNCKSYLEPFNFKILFTDQISKNRLKYEFWGARNNYEPHLDASGKILQCSIPHHSRHTDKPHKNILYMSGMGNRGTTIRRTIQI